ncbi:hypothetical protein CAEBREN_30835 [Caenorhabditis brenneri]|uniref:Fibronectin type-III domain-containing protein n=1 Tax=Caenorhabditis brenneri TaxID=135651 RepID=G0MSR9_CAEBE|nr:hypothetical protein CAEBREN_30835 [Caenorhabditis brenneri]
MSYINEIFLCVIESWTNAPTAPRNLTVVVNTEDRATLNWNEPEELPNLVDHYKVYLSARTGKLETETFYTTKEKEFKLEGLLIQFGYTVHVVAIAAPFNGSDDWYKSQRSNTVGFVTGDELLISTAEIRTPSITKNLTMHCSLRLIKGTENDIEWVKVNGNETELLEEGEKYSVTSYVDKERSEVMLSGLRISGFNNETDFGAYRCYMKNFRIEYGEVVVTEFNFMEQPPMDSPPETVLECCLRQSHTHRDRCYSICYQDDQEKKTIFKPNDYFPRRKNCAKEVHTVFRCALKSFNNVACCIHAKIPFRCLGLCDTNFEADPEKVPYCYNLKAFYTCKLETVSVKPDPITNIDVTHNLFSSGFKFTWTKSTDADVHHIYYRIRGQPWHVLVTTGTIFNIRQADELVVLTVNEFGYSQPYRLAYDINGWSEVDHW